MPYAEHLLIRTEQTQLQVFRVAQEDAAMFTHASLPALVAPWPLPAWWTFKFQQEALTLRRFNADRLMGFKVGFYDEGTCYLATMGKELRMFLNKTAEECYPARHLTWSAERKYAYKFSVFGIQTYRSIVDCLPLAANEELELEVVNVPFPVGSSSYTVTHAPCRITIRFAFNADEAAYQMLELYRHQYSTQPANPRKREMQVGKSSGVLAMGASM